MRRKLATLEVWSVDEPFNSESSFNPTTRHGVITVSTKGTVGLDVEGGGVAINNIDEFRDVLAHEMGHFIGYATDEQVQYVAGDFYMKSLASIFGHMPVQMEAEVKAWDRAEKMRHVDPGTRKRYLATYE